MIKTRGQFRGLTRGQTPELTPGLIDAHQHFWALGRAEVGWPTPDLAAIYRDFGPGDYRTEAAGCGIAGTVLVQSQPSAADTDWLLALAAGEPLVAAVVGWVDLAAPDAGARLRQLTAQPKFRGVRPMLQGLAEDDWILRPEVQPALEAMVALGLRMDALVRPRHLPHIAELARRLPRLPIVIDHAAKPDFRSGDLAQWSADIGAFAALPNTWCKLSGLWTEAGPGQCAEAETFRPCVDRLLEVFGAQRLLWGSDWPVLRLAGSLRDWLAQCRGLLRAAGLGSAALTDVFDGNARRFYAIPTLRADAGTAAQRKPHRDAVAPPPVASLRAVGHTAVRLSALGFGTAPIGNLYRPVDAAAARAAVERALAAGVRHFDTAPYYGLGIAEQRLGEALAGRMEAVTLSTKVGRLLRGSGRPSARRQRHGFAAVPDYEVVFDYGYDGVMRSFESSLQRLGTDRVDVLLAHDLGMAEHGERHPAMFRDFVDGGYRALAELKADGRVGAIGTGTREWQVCEALLDEVDLDCLLLAGRCTLLEQAIPERFFQRCHERGTAIVLAGVFNSGILATGTGGGAAAHYEYQQAPAEVLARVAQLESACAEFGVPLPAAALQFALTRAQVAGVVVGWASADEVEASLAWLATTIPVGFWQALAQRGLLPEPLA